MPSLTSVFFGGSLGLARGKLDERLLAAVLEDHDALGDREHVLLLADDEVGVGRVAGAQRDVRAPGRARSRRRRASRRPSAGPAARCARPCPVTTSVGSAPTLMRAGRPTLSLPTSISSTVPLKMRSLMSAIVGELGARLVGGQRHDRIARVDGAGQDGAGGRGADDRLHRDAGSVWMRPLRVRSRLCSALATAILASSKASRLTSRSDFGSDAVLESSCGALEVRLGALVGGLRRVELAVDVGQLLRRRVGRDLEERVAGLDPVADVDQAALDDARRSST